MITKRFLRRESWGLLGDMQWRSPFQTYSSISCGQCLKSGNHLYVENIDHLHHPPNFLVPLESTPFLLSAPSNHWSVFFFFLFTYFLSECHTNGIIYYVALWVWLFHIPINSNWRLSVMLSISFFSFYLFIYFSEQHTIIWICYCLSVYQWEGT